MVPPTGPSLPTDLSLRFWDPVDVTARGPCTVCRKAGGAVCERCGLAFWCSLACAEVDRAYHQASQCELLAVRRDTNDQGVVEEAAGGSPSTGLGRYLVATRDLPLGTVVLRAKPLVAIVPPWAPVDFLKLFCVSCMGDVPFVPFFQCARCGWPVCHSRCSDNPVHAAECAVFQRAGFKLDKASLTMVGPLLWIALSALRTHLASKTEPRLAALQSSHSTPLAASPRAVPVLGVADAVNWRTERSASQRQRSQWWVAARWLRQVAKVRDEDAAEADLVLAAGRNDINAVTLNPLYAMSGGPKGKACFLYGALSLLEHNCRPNCVVMALEPRSAPTGLQLVMTGRLVRKGERLSLDYLDAPFADAVTRRALLRRGWSFVCHCDSCERCAGAGPVAEAERLRNGMPPLRIGSPCCPICMGAGKQSFMVALHAGDGEAAVTWRCEECRHVGDQGPMVRAAEGALVAAKTRVGPVGAPPGTAGSRGLMQPYMSLLSVATYPNGPLHSGHRLTLGANLFVVLLAAKKVLGDSLLVGDVTLAQWLEDIRRLLNAMEQCKPGLLSQDRFCLLFVQADYLIWVLRGSHHFSGENIRQEDRDRAQRLMDGIDQMKPMFQCSSSEREFFQTRFLTPAQDFFDKYLR